MATVLVTNVELVDRVELLEVVGVVGVVEVVKVVELSADVTPALSEALVEELARSVLCEPLPVTTGLTYTVSVFDACGEAVDVTKVLALPPLEVGVMELPPVEACAWTEVLSRQTETRVTLTAIPLRKRILT